ncbi:DNA cytosine methyltransferase [Halomonas cupida]|uniref:DNA cytosine methyltransferase n=1 Tax=Halomonas cupida TaxID=44933 RepID=UPI0039B5B7F9
MNELALFAGAGGGILGGHLMGWRTVCAVERDAYAAQVLAQRQNDGALPAFPIWSDVCSFDGAPWRGLVDVVSGGFPCQDISVAGTGDGLEGERSGLWEEMRRIVGEVRPSLVIVENSPALTSRGLGRVLGDLAELGFDAEWGVLGASDVGAPHRRKRIWIVAHTNSLREPQQARGQQECRLGVEQCSEAMANTHGQCQQRIQCGSLAEKGRPEPDQRPTRSQDHAFGGWPVEPSVGRVADGVAHRVDRIKALGNGQVPRVAAAAFNHLAGRD